VVTSLFTITVEPNLAITTTDISTPENTDKVIDLTANKGGVNFFIAGGTDRDKFSLGGTTLTFKATDFEARDDKTIGSTESAKQKVGALVIAKSDQTIDKDGIVDLDI
jgi:hypothetical protein